ncbi:MAG: type II toxin-antitoxin system death-on-curing family toxin [Methanothrix sp.]|nr:type II toxin-antitoxin system death-on-curing family toxin [Methanothrix sp.]
MDPITEEQFLAMNSHIIKYDDDNRPGIRDGAGSDLYFQLEAINYETDPIMKASLAIYSANSHIFNNGNKRTAFALADIILGEYGYYIGVERDELIGFSCWVARIDPNAISKEDVIEEIIKWIKTRMRRLEL